MAYAMTKQGSLDNAIVYEFVCDTIADMNAIQNKYRTIGSIAVVLKGESEGLEVYIASSDKQWNSLSSASGSDSLTGGGLTIYICSQNEVSNGVPSISEPDESTVYLVSNNGDTGNLYDEFIYVNNAWEKWGSAGIDVSGFAPKASPVFTGSISLGRKANTTVGENSVAEGSEVTASGNNSHAEGAGTTASGYQSHAEGVGAQATGDGSHAEGGGTHATGSLSHTEGGGTTASGVTSHAEGGNATASGTNSHAEGGGTTASGDNSHAEGEATTASGLDSHAEGLGTTALGRCEHVSGRYNKLDTADTWTASTSYTVGALVKRDESYVDAGGTTRNITKIYKCKTANSDSTFNSSKWEEYGQYLFVIGNGTANNSRNNAFSVGWTGNVAEGSSTIASGIQSHAEGNTTKAFGTQSHAEGCVTTASGAQSHVEGLNTTASGTQSHAEGCGTIALGKSEHASGIYNVLGDAPTWTASTSYIVGDKVKRTVSFTDGDGTSRSQDVIYRCRTANSDSSFDIYKWEESGQWLEVVGNGTASNARSNACALDWDGNEYLAGDIYVGCNSDSTGGTKVATVSQIPDVSGLAPKADPEFTGSISLNRKANTTVGTRSFAVGFDCEAAGINSHSEGFKTSAQGGQSHAEGHSTIAVNNCSHAEGQSTEARGDCAHAEGLGTIARANAHVGGKYNKDDTNGDYAEIIGNGTGSAANNRSNARALDWNGNEYIAGDLYVGCAADSTGGVKLARIPAPSTATDGTYNLQATVSSGTITYSWVAGA